MRTATRLVSLAGVDVDQVLHHEQRARELPAVELAAIGPRELSVLAEVADLAARDTIIRGFSLLAGESQEPPWIISVPESLLAMIASMDRAECFAVAALWSDALSAGWSTESATLGELLDRARQHLDREPGPFVLYVNKVGRVSE